MQSTIRNSCDFSKGSNYDYHFIIKELAEEWEGQFERLWKKYWEVHNFFSTNTKKLENGK